MRKVNDDATIFYVTDFVSSRDGGYSFQSFCRKRQIDTEVHCDGYRRHNVINVKPAEQRCGYPFYFIECVDRKRESERVLLHVDGKNVGGIVDAVGQNRQFVRRNQLSSVSVVRIDDGKRRVFQRKIR